jgi:hypothetical protein
MKPIVKAIWIDFESEAFMHFGEALETDTKMMCSATGLYSHYRRHTGDWVHRWEGRLARRIWCE